MSLKKKYVFTMVPSTTSRDANDLEFEDGSGLRKEAPLPLPPGLTLSLLCAPDLVCCHKTKNKAELEVGGVKGSTGIRKCGRGRLHPPPHGGSI